MHRKTAKSSVFFAPYDKVDFFWIPDDKRFRVWRSAWGGDQFEILTAEEFAALQVTCSRFSMRLVEHLELEEAEA